MRYIYNKVESGSEINIDNMKQEIDNENLTATKTEEEGINHYQKVVMNNMYKMRLRQCRWNIGQY